MVVVCHRLLTFQLLSQNVFGFVGLGKIAREISFLTNSSKFPTLKS